jgi:hypothetical protein
LEKRNWPNDPICKLCDLQPETPTHLCKDCPYTQEVWTKLKNWLQLSILDTVPLTGSIHKYWRKCRIKFEKRQRRTFDGIIIYFWWNIWKERNRRTFQQTSLEAIQVAGFCKDDIRRYQHATRNNWSVRLLLLLLYMLAIF